MLVRRISPGAVAVFTDRAGGVSSPPWDSLNLATHVGDVRGEVIENRLRLERLLRTRVTWMTQVHGASVRVLSGVPPAEAGECDAVVLTASGDHSPAVLVADCVPLLVADETGSVRAAVHVGRAGLFGGIVPRVLATLRELTTAPLSAVAGPHICGFCYEVTPDLADRGRELGADSTTRWGTPGIDLLAGIRRQLDGVPLVHVGGCTREDPALFSFRRDGVTGRLAGIVLHDTPRPMPGHAIELE